MNVITQKPNAPSNYGRSSSSVAISPEYFKFDAMSPYTGKNVLLNFLNVTVRPHSSKISIHTHSYMKYIGDYEYQHTTSIWVTEPENIVNMPIFVLVTARSDAPNTSHTMDANATMGIILLSSKIYTLNTPAFLGEQFNKEIYSTLSQSKSIDRQRLSYAYKSVFAQHDTHFIGYGLRELIEGGCKIINKEQKNLSELNLHDTILHFVKNNNKDANSVLDKLVNLKNETSEASHFKLISEIKKPLLDEKQLKIASILINQFLDQAFLNDERFKQLGV